MANIIVKDTFNAIQSKIAAVLGPPNSTTSDLGYNLTVSSAQVSAGATVYGNDANIAIGDINTIVTHQTGIPTQLSTFSKGQIISTEDLASLSSIVDSSYVRVQRNKVAAGFASVVTSDAYSDGTTWNTIRQHGVTLDWGSNAQFRGWGNLGGQISIGAGSSGGSGTPQTNSWSTLLNSVGIIVFGNLAGFQDPATAIRSGNFPNGGLYNILQNGQVGANAGLAFRILATDANYTGNSYSLTITPYPAATNVFNCTGFTLLATLTDPHVATPLHPTDYIDSNFSWNINTYYSYEKIPSVVTTTNNIT